MSFVFVFFLFFGFPVLGETVKAGVALETCLTSTQEMEWDSIQAHCSIAMDSATAEASIQILGVLASMASKKHLDGVSEEIDVKIQQHPLLDKNNDIKYNHLRRMGQRAYINQSLVEAEAIFLEALALAELQTDLDWISKSHNDLGVLYKRLGQYNLALHKYQQSLAFKLKLGDERLIGNTLYNVGALLLELEREAEAVDYLDQAVTAYTKYREQTENSAENSVNNRILHVYEDLVVANLRLGESEQVEKYIQSLKNHHINALASTEFTSHTVDLVWAKYYIAKGKTELADGFISDAMKTEAATNPLSLLKEKVTILMAQEYRKEAKEAALAGLKEALKNEEFFYISVFNQQLSEIVASEDLSQSITYLKNAHQARELFLAQKYDAEIDQISDQIKIQKIERDLIAEQLINTQKEQKISRLTNWILFATCILIISFVGFANSYFKRMREKESLLEAIIFHKQQWKILNDVVENKQTEDEKKVPEKQLFKESLVKAMVEAVDVWSRHTGQNRIDLAEKSRVWTITVDNGTLRTRAMDKYLSLKHLPANPRWRKVVRTCHFILSDSNLNVADRALINGNLKAIMNML